MNIAGLNKLGFPGAPLAASPGKAAPTREGREAKSFERVLSAKHEDTKTTSLPTPVRTSPQPVATAPAMTSAAVSKTAPAAADQPVDDTAPDEMDTDALVSASEAVPLPNMGLPAMVGGIGLGERALTTTAQPAAKTGLPVAVPAQDDGDMLTHRAAWSDFLRKMGDLGVSADDMMGAFASLSPAELAQPPEKAVDRVVLALGLNDQQAVLARQYLNDLIHKTKPKSMGEELGASSKHIGLTLMAQRELDRKALSHGLDSLERSFFRQPTPEQAAKGIQARDLRMAEERPIDRQAVMDRLAAGLPAQPELVGNPAVKAQIPAARALPDAAEIDSVVKDMEQIAPEDKPVVAALMKNFVAHQAAAQAAAAPMAASMPAAASATPALPAGMPSEALSAFKGLFSGGDQDAADMSDDGTGAGSQDPTLMTGLATGATGQHLAGALGKSEFQAQLAQSLGMQHKPAQAMGVPDLIQKAQVMVKDGGGEMKVVMHPEGLGEVAMRVNVDNGKVQVQMVTESDEAKKLIERSLGELKTGLQQSHLQVDSIKIDTATNLGKQLEQQYQDAQRQQAHANLEQFRQDQQGWRRSFFDLPTVRDYQSQGRAPLDMASPHASAARRNTGSRRLDLVA